MKVDPQVIHEFQTVRDWLRYGASEFTRAELFFGHGTDNAWDEAAALLLAVVALPSDKLAQIADTKLTREERERVAALLEARINTRKPLPYLTGEAYFAGLRFAIDDQVLIPRSPFAELIAARFEPWLLEEPERILDLCTGSGCMGIACALVFPDAQVDLSDVAAPAVALAARNVRRHKVEQRVQVVQSDLFEHLPERYDLMVCNPPYVNAEDMAELPEEFRYEPQLALASGDDGLDFTRRLLAQAQDHLTEQGLLVVEVGNSWAALEAAYPRVPFTWLELEQGGHGIFALTKAQLDTFAEELRR